MNERGATKRSSRVIAISVGTTAAQIIGASTQRVALVFSPPVSGSYTVSTEPTVAIGGGMVLVAGGAFLTITRELHGDAVEKPWSAIAAAAVTAGVVEVLE